MSTSGITSGPVGLTHSITLGEYCVYQNPVSETDNKNILLYLHNKWIGAHNSDDIISEIHKRKYLNTGRLRLSIPKRIFKKMKAEYADLLCKNGIVRLGRLSSYEKNENPAIADRNEGLFICQAVGQNKTVYATVRANEHVLVYCVTKDINATFDSYDSCVEISNPAEFAARLGKALQMKFAGKNALKYSTMADCHYQHSRIVRGALHGFAEALVDLGELSVDTIDVVSDRKFIIKEQRFIADNEFRFAFVMQGDVQNYVTIECTDIIRLCRRVS